MRARASGAWSFTEPRASPPARRGCRSAAPEPLRSSWMGRNSHQHRSSACGIVRLSSLIVVTVAAQLCLAPNVAGQQPATREGAPAASQIQRIAIVLARETHTVPPPLSLLDMPPPDDGVAGARLAIDDNNTTGRFLKQEFTLDVVQSGNPQELVSDVEK